MSVLYNYTCHFFIDASLHTHACVCVCSYFVARIMVLFHGAITYCAMVHIHDYKIGTLVCFSSKEQGMDCSIIQIDFGCYVCVRDRFILAGLLMDPE